nr:hypothetical protein [Nostoc sp. FACHB-892]
MHYTRDFLAFVGKGKGIFYVTGKVGVVCGQEPHSEGQSSIHWLIQVDSDQENILVSLKRNEFEVITPKLE